MASDTQKVKLLCSFGGKILPRPSDGALRYAGGHTRIVSLRRSSTLSDLFAKIGQIFNGPVSAVKYQLPDEDLDALISISSQEDLENMMEEFDRISEIAPDGSARMRIFLFSPADLADANEVMDTGQSYIDAVNGIGLKRKDSLVSASSNEGTSPSILSPTHGSINIDPSKLGFFGDETLVAGKVEPQQVQFFNPNVNVVNAPAAQQYVHPIYVNATSILPVGGNFKPVQGKMEPLLVAGDLMGAVEGNLKPNQGKVEAFVEESLYRSDQNSNNGINSSNNHNKGFHHQPLSQLPPLHPTHIQQLPNMYVPPMWPYPQQPLRLEDCQMCQKSLPHAHSDTLINEHANGNGNGSGSSNIHEPRPVLQSHHSEDPARLQASLRPENTVEPKVETAAVAAGQFSRQHEDERAVHQNVEALDHSKVMHPTGVIRATDPTRLQSPPRVATGPVVDNEPKAETLHTGGQFGACGFTQEISHPHEKERLVHPNIEAFDPVKVLHPHNAVSGALADSMVEPKVDNVAASAQFGAYGFHQIPKIPQLHDNERLLVNPNVPTVAGLPGDTQASYAVVTNPSQPHFPDPFQPLSQNVVPSHHLAKQDVVTKQNVSIARNENFHAAEPPSRVSVPEISYDYVRPINGLIESLCVSTFEPLGITEQLRATGAVNRCLPMLKPENSTLIAENNHVVRVVRPQVGGNAVFLGNSYIMSGIVPEGNSARPINQLPPPSVDLEPEHPPLAADNTRAFRSQAGGNAVYFGNAFMASGIVPEGNSIRPINQMPPCSVDFTPLQSVQPSGISQSATGMVNHGPLFSYNQEMRVQPEVPNERLLVMPTYSCGIAPAYNNNNVISVVPVRDQKDEASWFHPKDALNNIAASQSGTIPIQYSNSGGSNGHAEQFQGPSPSDSLFCNQDPRKILGNMQMVPPRPNKVSSKEFIAPKDVCTETQSVRSDVAVLAEEGGFHHLQNSTNKDLCTEPVRLIQGEEHIEQEVPGLAEQVVASVLQPSVPPEPVTFSHEGMESDLPSNRETGFSEANALIQSATAVDDHKFEGIRTKQADKMNFVFPFTDDIGHLQIIKNSDLEELRELGSGTFGTVYHGKWRGSDVAIKRINDRCFAGKPSEEERMRADFWNEACKLADMHHPNVVAFYGVVLDGPGSSFATVTEFMVNGSLRRALQKNDKSLDKRKRLLISMDVAFGMEYLHGKNLIHFDLKSDNLLVNLRDPQRPICKVADLGLSKVKRQTLISGGVRGTLPWMAPELLNGGSTLVSDKVDVFSFGIVLWELLTGEEPYAELHYGAIIGGIVSNTLRPSVPESCDSEWRSLMEQCWSAEPSERPTFTEIASRLRSMAASLPQKG